MNKKVSYLQYVDIFEQEEFGVDIYTSKALCEKCIFYVKVINDNELVCDLSKVPKRENFSIAFFAQSEPIWTCDVGTSKKIKFFYQLTPDIDGCWFFAAYSVCGKPQKNF